MSNIVLQEAKSGSVEALNELIGLVSGYVCYIIKVQTGTSRVGVDTEDMTQDALLKVVECLAQFRGDNYEAFLGWVGAIARNIVYKALEKSRSKSRGGHVTIVSLEGFDVASRSEWAGRTDSEFYSEFQSIQNAIAAEEDSFDREEIVKQVEEIREAVAGHPGKRVREVMGVILSGGTVQSAAQQVGCTLIAAESAVKRFRQYARDRGLGVC